MCIIYIETPYVLHTLQTECIVTYFQNKSRLSASILEALEDKIATACDNDVDKREIAIKTENMKTWIQIKRSNVR